MPHQSIQHGSISLIGRVDTEGKLPDPQDQPGNIPSFLALYQPMMHIWIMRVSEWDRGRRMGAPEGYKKHGYVWVWL